MLRPTVCATRERGAGERAGKSREEEGHLPPPPPSPFLGFGPCPNQGCATPRAAAEPLHAPAEAAGVPSPLPAAHTPRNGTHQRVPGAPSPLSPEPLQKQQQWQQQARGSPRGEESCDGRQPPPRSLLRSRACPPPDPGARGALLPNAPLPEAGAEAVSAVPQQPPPLQPSAVAAPRWGSGRGGWVEDATPY